MIPLIFQREHFNPALALELEPLLVAHYQEVAHYKDIPLAPDFERYFAIEAVDRFRVYTARTRHEAEDEGGKLVGYAAYFVDKHLHYMGHVFAVQDVIFIAPEARGDGKSFIAWCDDQLKADGVNVVTQHVKAAHNFGPMLERMGYELMDLIYTRKF